MQTKHTPGPWHREGTTVYALESIGYRGKAEQFQNRIYFQVQAGPNTPVEEAEAVARLLATAPEMRELLHEAWVALPESKHNADLNARIKALLAEVDNG